MSPPRMGLPLESALPFPSPSLGLIFFMAFTTIQNYLLRVFLNYLSSHLEHKL